MGVDPTQQRRDQRMTGDRGTGDRMGSSARARALASLDRTRQRMAQAEAADSTAPSIPYTVEPGARTVLPEQPGQARGVAMPNRYMPPPLSPDSHRYAREQQESERSRRHPRRGSTTPREPHVIQLEPIEIYGRVPRSTTTETSEEAVPNTASASVERGTSDRGTETTPRSPLRVDLSPEGRERARQSMDSFLQDQPQLLPNDPSTLPLRLRRSQLPPRPGYLLDRWFAGDDAALEPLRPQLDQLESRLDRSGLPGNLAGIGLGVLRFIREISASLVSLMQLISELPWDTLHVINPADLEEFAITLRDLLSAEIEDQAVTRALAEVVWAPILRIVEHFREAIRLAEEGHQVQSSAEITQATLEIIALIDAVREVLQRARQLPEFAHRLHRLRRRMGAYLELSARRLEDSRVGRAARELYQDERGSVDVSALLRRHRRSISIPHHNQIGVLRYLRRTAGFSRLPLFTRVERYVETLVGRRLIPRIRGVARVILGQIGDGTSGKDLWAFRRGRRGPVSIEIKTRGTGRSLALREFERSAAFGDQVTPEGDVADWLRWLRANRAQARSLVDEGLLGRNWLDEDWVRQHGYEHFQNPENRFLIVVSPGGVAGVESSALPYIRLRDENVIRLDLPEELSR